MKNRKLSLMLLFSFALALTGCNKEENVQNEDQVVVTEIPEEIDETGFGITLEEQQMCAEYAAGVLMKYNAGSNMRVLEGKKLENLETQEQIRKAQEEKREQLAAEYQANKKESSDETSNRDNNSGSSSSDSTEVISYIDDMSVATGTEAFAIRYEGYEIADSYPDSGEDTFFAIEAVQGKVLLVAKFNVTNNSGQTENLNMYSNQGKYRLKLDGGNYKAQHTLLLNDLAMYKDDIEAGETIETVLIFEIPEEKASAIGNMELDITIGDEVDTMLLQGGSAVVNVSDTQKDEDASDLAEEYEAALRAEEEALAESNSEEDNSGEESSGGNVTIVGSNNSISQE